MLTAVVSSLAQPRRIREASLTINMGKDWPDHLTSVWHSPYICFAYRKLRDYVETFHFFVWRICWEPRLTTATKRKVIVRTLQRSSGRTETFDMTRFAEIEENRTLKHNADSLIKVYSCFPRVRKQWWGQCQTGRQHSSQSNRSVAGNGHVVGKR